jgi:hypothetical protein
MASSSSGATCSRRARLKPCRRYTICIYTQLQSVLPAIHIFKTCKSSTGEASVCRNHMACNAYISLGLWYLGSSICIMYASSPTHLDITSCAISAGSAATNRERKKPLTDYRPRYHGDDSVRVVSRLIRRTTSVDLLRHCVRNYRHEIVRSCHDCRETIGTLRP